MISALLTWTELFWWLQLPMVRCRRLASTSSWLVRCRFPTLSFSSIKWIWLTIPNCWNLVELELRELLTQYEFPGDDIPIIRGSALKALEAEDTNSPDVKCIQELMDAVDAYIPDRSAMSINPS